MKILFVSYADFLQNTYEGGKKCSLRNYTVLERIFGQSNIDGIVFSREKHECEKENFTCVQASNSKYTTLAQTFMGYVRGYTKSCEEYIVEKCKKNQYDIVFLDFSGYGISIPKIKKVCKSKIYVFFVDIEYLYEKNRAKNENALYSISAHAVKKSEQLAVKYADYLITLNSRDSKLLKKIYNRESDLELVMSFENVISDEQLKQSATGDYMLFVGSYFGPNVDGLKWYVENVAPHVKEKLIVVGHHMERLKEKYERDNVQIIGTVDDLTPYYINAKAVVMPIQYGDGMKVKTAEALMYGKTVLGTTEAFEGYEIEEGRQGYCCNSPKEFIDKINSLSNVNTTFNADSRQLYLEKYSLESSVNKFRKICGNED